MNRRHFVMSLAAPLAMRAAPAGNVRITRIRVATLQGRFHKFVTMNAYDEAPKGHTYEHPLIRIETNQGVEGIGPAGYAALDGAFFEDVRALIGANPLEIYQMDSDRIQGRSARFASVLTKYKHLDGPLFDLIGKLTGKAAWQLMGDSVRERVEGLRRHISKACKTIVAAEDDRSTCDVVMAKGYNFGKGAYTVSMEPGLGLLTDSKVYDQKCKATERVVA